MCKCCGVHAGRVSTLAARCFRTQSRSCQTGQDAGKVTTVGSGARARLARLLMRQDRVQLSHRFRVLSSKWSGPSCLRSDRRSQASSSPSRKGRGGPGLWESGSSLSSGRTRRVVTQALCLRNSVPWLKTVLFGVGIPP